MSTENISLKIRTETARKFKDSFALGDVGYIFIGKPGAYSDENNPDEITDTVLNEKELWDNMIGAKKISPNNIEFVIPRYNWGANNRYRQYDDTIPLETLLSPNESGNLLPMYVMNSEGNIYKCLCNNVSSLSTIEPKGDFNTSNGFISTADNYLWKYMYGVRSTNRFLSNEWIPVPYTNPSYTTSGYFLDDSNIIDGSLNKIKVIDNGYGYVHSVISVGSFGAGNTFLSVSNTSNINVNMSVTGTGILTGTYITSISNELNRIFLSTPTISSGGGSGNNVSITTRVYIQGDGFGTLTSVDLVNTEIRKITVTSGGVGYSRANVTVYGTATTTNTAIAKAVLPPKYGHGFNPAKELGGTNVMIIENIGEVDSTEGGKISDTTKFRQYGIILNPYKYNEDFPSSNSNSNTVISMTTDITVASGTAYQKNEFVYQGTIVNPTFYGYVNDEESDVIRLTNTYGSVLIGELLKGAAVERPVANVKYPDLKPYAGDIVYSRNILAVERSPNQSEEIKLIVKF